MAQEKVKINWSLLWESVEYYKNKWFECIDCPWIIPQEFTRITSPDRNNSFATAFWDLVGSSEQSFVYLSLSNQIKPWKYVTLTPCYRDEPEDNTHKKYFMKTELFQSVEVNEQELDNIIKTCYEFFEKNAEGKLEIIKTDTWYDIECNWIEIGSYGIRHYEGLNWIYATWLAEPRFSISNIS